VIQTARSSRSKSLLRELESAVFILHRDIEHFFLNAANKVVRLRKDPNRVQTGAKALKDTLLSYLEQQGEIKTVNVWCRKIRISEIKDILSYIKQSLIDVGIQGVVELHMQDREINSPHIQFVGTKPVIAEKIIAEIVVKFCFEDSYESAVNRSAVPAFFTDEKIKVVKTDKVIEEREAVLKLEEEKKNIREAAKNIVFGYTETIKKQSDKILEILNGLSVTTTTLSSFERRKAKKRLQLLNTDELLSDWKQRRRRR
jgi:hypothetical protein